MLPCFMSPRLLAVVLTTLFVAQSCERRSSDADRDGLADDFELALALQLFPVLHVSPADGCPEPLNPKPVLFRTRHPSFQGAVQTDFIVVNYVILYDMDCGGGGHRGDNEPLVAFARRSDAGDYVFESLAATAHTNTGAEVRTSSTHRDIWVEPDKHSNFAPAAGCAACPEAGPAWNIALFNVGEPGAPLVSDLAAVSSTFAGIDPWSTQTRFFGAGIIGAESLGLRYFAYVTRPPRGAPGARWDD